MLYHDIQDNNFQRETRLMHVLLTAVNIIRDVRAYVRACIYAHTSASVLHTHRAHLTVLTHARRARHSMNQNKPVPERELDKETKRKGRVREARS